LARWPATYCASSVHIAGLPRAVGDGTPPRCSPDGVSLSSGVVRCGWICTGYVATDLNGFRGVRTPEQGAAIAIKLATPPEDGPTGKSFEDAGRRCCALATGAAAVIRR
jgi:hypothetical protein